MFNNILFASWIKIRQVLESTILMIINFISHFVIGYIVSCAYCEMNDSEGSENLENMHRHLQLKFQIVQLVLILINKYLFFIYSI